MKKDINGKDFLKLVEWSDEDGCFVGSAPPLIGPSCHGGDEAEVYRELCQIVKEWIAIHKDDDGGFRSQPPARSIVAGSSCE
ncbi:MAG: hypothetical protein ACO1QR_03665 [Chthoniobacteraceae bacterium]